MKAPLSICICMGSSCFARGNGETLEVLEEYIARHGLEAEIDLSGSRCEGICAHGPNLTINGTQYQGVDAGTVIDLVREHLDN